jgi:hypothetical protein
MIRDVLESENSEVTSLSEAKSYFGVFFFAPIAAIAMLGGALKGLTNLLHAYRETKRAGSYGHGILII